MAPTNDQFDAAVENSLATGGVKRQKYGDTETEYATAKELLEAKEINARQRAAAAGGQFFTGGVEE